MIKYLPTYLRLSLCALTCILAGCAIPDDIPYPTVETAISAISVEGQCDASGYGYADAVIDKNSRTVHIYVNDSVDITHLRITHLEVANDASVVIDSVEYLHTDTYTPTGYDIAGKKDAIYINAQRAVIVTLHTYQDYEWTITVEQVVNREIEVEGQVGNAVIDPDTRIAIIYVNESQDISKIKVRIFTLGGDHGTVEPDPTQEESVDFTSSRRYYVTYGWSDLVYIWTVYVYTTEGVIEPTAEVTNTPKGACLIYGSRPNGIKPTVTYKAQSDDSWTSVTDEQVKTPTATSYEVELNNLHSDTPYLYRVEFPGFSLAGGPFYFQGEQLENSSFDHWHIEGEGKKALYLPWADGDAPYWDTGNHGATTVGASNSTYVEEGERCYANLQSKYIVVKFAAGNIFTGKYLETDGTNGVLSFGRPFTSRPAKMQFDFQYQTSTITKTGGIWYEVYGQYITRELYEGLKGQPDSCSVYIALGDWEPELYVSAFSNVREECPYLIRTRPEAGKLHLMDMNSPNLIGFAQMTCGDNVNQWTTQTLNIHYRNNRTPTTVIVVASSSKYGDYFTGGESSLLKIDNIRLLY